MVETKSSRELMDLSNFNNVTRNDRIPGAFFQRDVLEVAPDLIGKRMVRIMPGGEMETGIISETEAYKGSEDLACHARRGRTSRNKVMFEEGGLVYMYLIYGIYWMMNIVTGREGDPQAVLIRGLREVYGPGRLTRQFQIDRSFYGEDLSNSSRLWIEEGIHKPEIHTAPRIGIEYAGDYWKNVPWRFFLSE